MSKECLRKKTDTPCPHLYTNKRPFKGKVQSPSSRGKTYFQKREEWEHIIPADVGMSTKDFESTDEEVNSGWVDILSDSLSSTIEEMDSSAKTRDLISLTGMEIANHSSPEIMRFEGSNFSEEIILPIEYPRKTVEFIDSNFSPKLTSSPVRYSFENSRIFDSSVDQSTKLGKNKDWTVNSPDISNFVEDKDADSLENENSLPSTVSAPDIFNFEEVKDGEEISLITTENIEHVVDSVFEYSDEPKGPNYDDALITVGGSDEQQEQVVNERRSLNGTPINTTQTRKIYARRFFFSYSSNFWFSRSPTTKVGRRREKISPSKRFIHSKLSSGELSTSIIRQSSSKNEEKNKKRGVPLYPPNPPKTTTISGTSKHDPYHFPRDESDLDVEISIRRDRPSSEANNIKARKKKRSSRRKKKYRSSQSPVILRSLRKKEAEDYAEYLKTITICPLSLQYSCCAGINEDTESDEI